MRKTIAMTNTVSTNAADAINAANAAIDKQTGGAGEQVQATRAELNKTMSEVDVAIRKQTSSR